MEEKIVMDDELLFGGKLGWRVEDWTSSDDRVRGGQSVSHLVIDNGRALFTGSLDIETLGGAGFASQRTTGEDRVWDLSHNKGIFISFDPETTDEKQYTFIVKDSLLPPRQDGREQSTVSWEFDFSIKDATPDETDPRLRKILIPLSSLKPTYRGRPKEDAPPLAYNNIKRMSIMMRSFFGTQHGHFAFMMVAIGKIQDTGDGHESSNTHIFYEDDQSSMNSIVGAKTATSSGVVAKGFFNRFACWKR